MGRFEQATGFLTPELQSKLLLLPDKIKENAQEIRLRTGRAAIVECGMERFFLTESGGQTKVKQTGLFIMSAQLLSECFARLCNYSQHAYQTEIKSGYITVQGGHRVGFCGSAVCADGSISGIRNLSGMNIRIARQAKGVAEKTAQKLLFGSTSGLLVAGAPSSGKTTFIRDLARILSDEKKLAVIDQRGEIAGVYQAAAQNDFGVHCDILDGYPKPEGIEIATRVLSPEIIVCDEIGGSEEAKAILQAVHAGVTIMATVHAGSVEELLKKQHIRQLLEASVFENIVFLSARPVPCTVTETISSSALLEKTERRYD